MENDINVMQLIMMIRRDKSFKTYFWWVLVRPDGIDEAHIYIYTNKRILIIS